MELKLFERVNSDKSKCDINRTFMELKPQMKQRMIFTTVY